MAGADPSAYDAVFAEIAEKRADLTARREARTRRDEDIIGEKPDRRGGPITLADYPRLLAQIRRVLESPDLPGEEKRDALGQLVERVYPTPEGARVVFLPGVIGGGDPQKPIPASSPTAPAPASNLPLGAHRPARRRPNSPAAHR